MPPSIDDRISQIPQSLAVSTENDSREMHSFLRQIEQRGTPATENALLECRTQTYSTTRSCPITPCVQQEKTVMFATPIKQKNFKQKNSAIGDIWLRYKGQHTLNDLETRLIRQVANQCMSAVQPTRLYHTSQAHSEELERLNHLKDEFLSTVSHELRSPMTNIRLAIQMLEAFFSRAQDTCEATEDEKIDWSKGRTYLQILRTECEREISLIKDLLDPQQLGVGSRSTDSTSIALEKWLPCLIQPFQERAQQRQQSLFLHLAPGLPIVESSPGNLNRILAELLHNACKYTPPGETIAVAVQMMDGQAERSMGKEQPAIASASASAACLQISVTNTGVEIPASEQDRIFDKFYRIPEGDRWQQGGTGLGLALVKHIIESIGGSIRVKSAALRTCFTLQIPISG